MSEPRTETTDDSRHSPAPWSIDWAIAGGGRHQDIPTLIYACISSKGANEVSDPLRITNYMRKADIHLIAAAPDLLNALKNLYALVQGECPSLLEDDHHDVMVAQAIAKAEGRS